MERYSKNIYLTERKILSLQNALKYLDMKRNTFNRHVRPSLNVIKIGTKSVYFEASEIDNFIKENKKIEKKTDISSWHKKNRQASTNVKTSGISTKKLEECEFVNQLQRLAFKKQKTF